jgi:hypothetical protein
VYVLRTLFFVGFILTIYPALAQSRQGKPPRMLVGIVTSPDFSYRSLHYAGRHADFEDPFLEFLIASRNERESPKLGLTTGLSVIYNFSKNVGLETGLYFSNKGEREAFKSQVNNEEIDPFYGFIGAPVASLEVNNTYSYHYLDIPIRAIYTAHVGKFQLMGGLGIQANVFLAGYQKAIVSRDGELSNSRRRLGPDFKFEPILFSAMASFGVGYRFRPKWQLRVEPVFRHSLYSFVNQSIKTYLWSAGLQVGCYYALW